MIPPRFARFLRFTFVLVAIIFFISHRLVTKKEHQRILQVKEQLKGQEYDLTKDFGNSLDLKYEKVVYSQLNGSNYDRVKASFFSLARNDDLPNLAQTVRSIEDRFNHQFHYDWVFVNDEEFTEHFKKQIKNLVSGDVYFEQIPKEFWSYPEWVDVKKAQLNRLNSRPEMIYGGQENYRFMCRFFSGLFFNMDILKPYDFIWRVEPETLLHCDVNYDVFKFMIDNDKHYGFTISLLEFESTIPSLWTTVQDFIKLYPNYIQSDNLYNFISNDQGDTYNLCHFWTNFEIVDLKFLRSEVYTHYFNYLDQHNGFFYERWGDAPVISIAVALFLKKSQVHFFEDIGYFHNPNQNCPIDDEIWERGNCLCDQRTDVTFRAHSCTGMFYEAIGKEKPKGWELHIGV